jgi:hypothetical protein
VFDPHDFASVPTMARALIGTECEVAEVADRRKAPFDQTHRVVWADGYWLWVQARELRPLAASPETP